MMKTKWLSNLSLLLIMLVGLNACQNSDIEDVSNSVESSQTSHAISAEEALANLNDFLKDSPTRAGENLPKATDLIPMKIKEMTTRAPSLEGAKNLIYVANFPNDNGFAILAGDDRIREKVIAVADNGNFTNEEVQAVASFLKNEENYVDKDYPTSGDGFIHS